MKKCGYIAVVGRPNAGKSTLLNSVVQTDISIVSPKAQTTRDRILGILTEDPGQMILIDTPGVHRAKEGGVNEYMMGQVKEALEVPSLIWYLADPETILKHELAVLEMLKGISTPVFLLLNKKDLFGKRIPEAQIELLEKTLTDEIRKLEIPMQGIRRISGLKGHGVKELVQESWSFLPEGDALYTDPDQVSDRPTRFFVAEKIRERLFYLLGEEVPYSCAVEIERFDEKSVPPRIEATIYVERESQKGIVIGQGGKKIKEIGQSARQQIEAFIGQKIFLGLKVKLMKDWSQTESGLRKIGYL